MFQIFHQYSTIPCKIQLIISGACPFWRSISKRISCSLAFNRSAAMDELLRSSVGEAPSLPLLIELFAVVVRLVAVDGWPWGEIGGDPALAKYSLCAVWNDGGCGFWAAIALECWAADILASNDWNDALGEYNAPTPGGNICDIWDGGALKRIETTENTKKLLSKFNSMSMNCIKLMIRLRWQQKRKSVKGQRNESIEWIVERIWANYGQLNMVRKW